MKKIKIYLDTADINKIVKKYKDKRISGYTTNPSLMKKNNIKSYSKFIKYVCSKISKPISFEIFSDNEEEIYDQAMKISNFSRNIFVKIPIVNSKGLILKRVIKKLSDKKVKLNITAVFTYSQFKSAYDALNKNIPSIISIFAGRIADTGIDPSLMIKKCVRYKKSNYIEILWASTREYLNIIQAEKLNCDIITVTPEIFNKNKIKNYNLTKYSIETSKMFYEDAKKMKLKL